MSEIILLANFVATAVMTGVIWFVQWVHYPLLASVPVDGAVKAAEQHQRRTGQVLALPIAVEGVTTLYARTMTFSAQTILCAEHFSLADFSDKV